MKIFKVEGGPERGQFHHKRILEAMEQRDPEKARDAMRAHLDQVRQFMDNDIVDGGLGRLDQPPVQAYFALHVATAPTGARTGQEKSRRGQAEPRPHGQGAG